MAELRERKPVKPVTEEEDEPVSVSKLAEREDSGISWLDGARAVVLLLLVSTALSYFITQDSFVWHLQRPKWASVASIKSYLVRLLPTCCITLPPSQNEDFYVQFLYFAITDYGFLSK